MGSGVMETGVLPNVLHLAGTWTSVSRTINEFEDMMGGYWRGARTMAERQSA